MTTGHKGYLQTDGGRPSDKNVDGLLPSRASLIQLSALFLRPTTKKTF